jgi:dTDP-4-dehydrorhamnose reductase
MLGTEVSLVLEREGLSFVGTDREVDITDPGAPGRFARGLRPDWIVNCAAYTAVDRAEEEGEAARRLNADGAGNIARTAAAAGARLIHLSTDYVFNGRGARPYREEDPTDPAGVYGLTKRDGERAVMEQNPRSYIIRTAWLYGRHGNNFVAAMLRLMNEREEVRVVDDQRGSPTWARDLASAVALLAARAGDGEGVPYGVYHYTNEGETTWYGFAREIYGLGRERGLIRKDCAVRPCTSAEYPAKAARPAYSVLDKGKIKAALGVGIPRWDESLKEYLETCGQ